MNDQNLGSWLEWKEACAIERCGAEARRELCAYAWRQGTALSKSMGLSIQLLAGERKAEDASEKITDVPSADATVWGYFEQRAVAGMHRSGKFYKDWIFNHAAGKTTEAAMLPAILKGVKLQLQMVLRGAFADEIALIRERLKHRINEPKVIESTDESPGEWLESIAGRAGNLMRPSLLQMVKPEERGDYERLAESIAGEWWSQASRREKVVLWAGLEGLKLDDEVVENAAGVKKSQLYSCVNEMKHWFAGRMKQCGEDGVGTQYIQTAALNELSQRVDSWAKLEKLTAVGFRKVEG